MTTFQAMQPHDYMVFLMTCMYKHKGWHKTCNDSTLKSVLQAARSTSGAEVHSKSSCKRKEEKKRKKFSTKCAAHLHMLQPRLPSCEEGIGLQCRNVVNQVQALCHANSSDTRAGALVSRKQQILIAMHATAGTKHAKQPSFKQRRSLSRSHRWRLRRCSSSALVPPSTLHCMKNFCVLNSISLDQFPLHCMSIFE